MAFPDPVPVPSASFSPERPTPSRSIPSRSIPTRSAPSRPVWARRRGPRFVGGLLFASGCLVASGFLVAGHAHAHAGEPVSGQEAPVSASPVSASPVSASPTPASPTPAAPALPDGLSASTVLVSRYDAVWQDAGTHNRFELDRAELGVAYRFGVLSGVFRVESIRSAGPDSYLGIDKNSLLPRVRFAYAEVAPAWEFIEARLRTGVVPEPWVETLESGYDVRGLAPLASQRGAFFPPADLGLRLDLSFLGGLATLRLAALNGEGHSQIDLNGGKNLTGILSLATPALELWGPWRVSLHGGFRDGSTGIGAIRNHRAMAALVLDHPWLQAGAEYAHAFGHRARGELEASSLGLWARGAFWLPALGYALRYERIDEDQRLAETERETVTGALWFEWRPSLWAPPGRPRSPAAVPATDRVRFYLGAEEQRAGAAVGPVPGMPDALNHRRIFFVAELVADFFGRAASPSLSFPANPPGATLPRKEDPS